MSNNNESTSDKIMRQIIKKSLFTERQIQIILKHRKLLEAEFPITRGAYYRQVRQSEEKLVAFFYTIVLLGGLDVLRPEDIDVMLRLSEQVNVISHGGVIPENVDEIVNVIDQYIRQACNT